MHKCTQQLPRCVQRFRRIPTSLQNLVSHTPDQFHRLHILLVESPRGVVELCADRYGAQDVCRDSGRGDAIHRCGCADPAGLHCCSANLNPLLCIRDRLCRRAWCSVLPVSHYPQHQQPHLLVRVREPARYATTGESDQGLGAGEGVQRCHRRCDLPSFGYTALAFSASYSASSACGSSHHVHPSRRPSVWSQAQHSPSCVWTLFWWRRPSCGVRQPFIGCDLSWSLSSFFRSFGDQILTCALRGCRRSACSGVLM